MSKSSKNTIESQTAEHIRKRKEARHKEKSKSRKNKADNISRANAKKSRISIIEEDNRSELVISYGPWWHQLSDDNSLGGKIGVGVCIFILLPMILEYCGLTGTASIITRCIIGIVCLLGVFGGYFSKIPLRIDIEGQHFKMNISEWVGKEWIPKSGKIKKLGLTLNLELKYRPAL